MKPTILIVPGLGSSGPRHWQTLWEKQHPAFVRVGQQDWETPACQDWVARLDEEVQRHRVGEVVVVAHSLACIAVAYWARQCRRRIKGAMLVAPADTEAEGFPEGPSGFSPVPSDPLPFPSLVVSSANDPYITEARARQLAQAWGSEYIGIGEAGHINTDAGYGAWDEGLALLKRLY